MKPLTRIVDFALEQAATQPLARRELIYRDLAAISATQQQAERLTTLADELARIERTHRQLQLTLQIENAAAPIA